MAGAGKLIVQCRQDGNGEGYLTVGEGAEERALYRFLPQTTCEKIPWGEDWPVSDWIQKWEPVLTEDAPQAGDGVDPGDLGVTLMPREDARGGSQATYRDHQLYTYKGDSKGADVNGRFPGLWDTVSPEIARDDCGWTKPRIPSGP